MPMLSSFKAILAQADWGITANIIDEMIEYHDTKDGTFLSACIIEEAFKSLYFTAPTQERIRLLLIKFYEHDPRVTLMGYRSNPAKIGYFMGVRLKQKYTNIDDSFDVPSRFDATMHIEIINLINKHAEMCRVIDATAALQRTYVKRRREEEQAVLVD